LADIIKLFSKVGTIVFGGKLDKTYSPQVNSEEPYYKSKGAEIMETLEAIEKRKSVRAYKPEQISDEALSAIIKAGQSAPNAGPFQLTVIQSSGLLSKLSEEAKAGMLNSENDFFIKRASLPGYDPIYGAPTVIILSAPDDNPFSLANTSLSAENMIIAATALGLGTCYLVTPKMAFDGQNAKELGTKAGIPEGYTFKCSVAVGYSGGDAFSTAKGKVNYVNYV
jgi:FMN reductase [NAD(P)H]